MKKITLDLLGLDTLNYKDKVGVLLSGGMDSALLLYLLAKHISNDIFCYTVPKHDGANLYVNSIVNWINTKVDKSIKYPLRVGNPNLYHERIVGNALYILKNECDIFYLAGNAYPESILPNGPKRIRINVNTIKQPFFDCYKTDILQSYVDWDVLDLLPLTHTCTEQTVGRCNQCWQCKERRWAFTELQISDTDT